MIWLAQIAKRFVHVAGKMLDLFVENTETVGRVVTVSLDDDRNACRHARLCRDEASGS